MVWRFTKDRQKKRATNMENNSNGNNEPKDIAMIPTEAADGSTANPPDHGHVVDQDAVAALLTWPGTLPKSPRPAAVDKKVHGDAADTTAPKEEGKVVGLDEEGAKESPAEQQQQHVLPSISVVDQTDCSIAEATTIDDDSDKEADSASNKRDDKEECEDNVLVDKDQQPVAPMEAEMNPTTPVDATSVDKSDNECEPIIHRDGSEILEEVATAAPTTILALESEEVTEPPVVTMEQHAKDRDAHDERALSDAAVDHAEENDNKNDESLKQQNETKDQEASLAVSRIDNGTVNGGGNDAVGTTAVTGLNDDGEASTNKDVSANSTLEITQGGSEDEAKDTVVNDDVGAAAVSSDNIPEDPEVVAVAAAVASLETETVDADADEAAGLLLETAENGAVVKEDNASDQLAAGVQAEEEVVEACVVASLESETVDADADGAAGLSEPVENGAVVKEDNASDQLAAGVQGKEEVVEACVVASDDEQIKKKVSDDVLHESEEIQEAGQDADIAPSLLKPQSSLQRALHALERGGGDDDEVRAAAPTTGSVENDGVDKSGEDTDHNTLSQNPEVALELQPQDSVVDDNDKVEGHSVRKEKEEYETCESSYAGTDDLNNDFIVDGNEEASAKADEGDGEDIAVATVSDISSAAPHKANEIKAGADEEDDQIGTIASGDWDQPMLQSNDADHVSDCPGPQLTVGDDQDVPRFIPKHPQPQPREHQPALTGTDEHLRALIQQELQRHSEALEKNMLARVQVLIQSDAAAAARAVMLNQQDQQDQKFETKLDAQAQKLALEENFKKEHTETTETMKEFVKYQTRQLHTRVVVPLEAKVMARMGSLQMSFSDRLQKHENELQAKVLIPLTKQLTDAQEQQGLDITTMKEQIATCLSESQRLDKALLDEKNSNLTEFESYTARFQKYKQEVQGQLSSLQELVEKEQKATFAKIEVARVMAREEQQAQQQKFITMGTTLADEIEDLEEKMTQLQAQMAPVSTIVAGFNKPQECMQTDIAGLMVKLASIQDAVHEEKRRNQQSAALLCRNNDMVESLEQRVAKLETLAMQESTTAALKKKDDEHLQAEMASQRVQLAALQEIIEEHSNASARLNQKRRVDTGSLTTLEDKVGYMEEHIDKKMKQLKEQHLKEMASMEEKMARLESRLEYSVVNTDRPSQTGEEQAIQKASAARKEAQDKEQLLSLQIANIALQETVARYKQLEADQQKAEMQALRETVARYQQLEQMQQRTEVESLRETVARFQAENALLREIVATANPKYKTVAMGSAATKQATKTAKEDLGEIVATSNPTTAVMTAVCGTAEPASEASKDDLQEIVATSNPNATMSTCLDSATAKPARETTTENDPTIACMDVAAPATETTTQDLGEIVAPSNPNTTLTLDNATAEVASDATTEESLQDIAVTSNVNATTMESSATAAPASEATKHDLEEIVAAASNLDTSMTMDSGTAKPVQGETTEEDTPPTPSDTDMTMDGATTKPATEATQEGEEST